MRRVYYLQSLIFIFIFLGILIMANLFAQQYHLRFDLTKEKRYTLSPQTVNVLKNLKTKVKVIGFFSSGSEREKAKDLLEQYRYHSRKFNYTFIDPDRHPLEAKKYNVTRYNTIVVESGEKREQIYEITEEKLTNAIVRVTRPERKVIYFLKGHGEYDIDNRGKIGYSRLKTALTDKGYIVKSLLLAKEAEIPKDAKLLVIAGPNKPLLSAEIKVIKDYIDRGGQVLFLLNPETGEELKDLLKEKGIILDDDMIVDKMSRLFGGDYLIPVIIKYNKNHPVTKDFNLVCFLPLARSIKIKKDLPKEIKAEILAWTSENAWGETDLKALKAGKALFDRKDIKGPVPVAVASWKEGENGFRIAVIGDADFLSNSYFQASGNGDFGLNLISWLTEEENLIAIPPKEIKSTPLVLSHSQGKVIFYLPVVVWPLLMLIVGIVVYFRRRKL
ncbi:MAG: GldG family protein [Candidatus Desulfofervidus auxilii]|nr:GldG family protein [Candidatus Desulfofervidus auxilii]